MPEKSSPIALDMQQDGKQARRWRRQTLTNGGGSTRRHGSTSQLEQSWERQSCRDSQREDKFNESSAFSQI